MKYKMQQKQNQRIQQITDGTLIVGADIAKETHVGRAIDFRGIELGKECVFDNDHEGLTKLVTWMKELQRLYAKTDIVFGVEPTGHYWFPLAAFLQEQHVRCDGKYTEPKLPTGVYANLRILMNLREKVMVNLGQVQRRIQNWLDRFFPEYTQVFKDWEGKASLITLREFSLPQDVVSLGASEIVSQWKKAGVKRAVGMKRAKRLVTTAETSIGLREGLTSARLELRTLLEQYDLFSQQRDEIMAQAEQLLNQIPGTEEMLSVPGMGVTTLAGFLAEVGELQGYDHGQQIIRLAGLNLKENSSGKRKGKTGISKRGRSRLRALLFRAILPMVATNPEFKALHHYYTTRPSNPLKKKQSLIALCGKLIRVLHTLGTKQIQYNADDLLGPLRKSQIQMAA